jgi:copper chaperone
MNDTTTIRISGMSCAHCVSAVRQALTGVPGVTVNDVTIGSAVVRLDGEAESLALAEAAIDEAGFDVVRGRVLNVTQVRPSDTPSA